MDITDSHRKLIDELQQAVEEVIDVHWAQGHGSYGVLLLQAIKLEADEESLRRIVAFVRKHKDYRFEKGLEPDPPDDED